MVNSNLSPLLSGAIWLSKASSVVPKPEMNWNGCSALASSTKSFSPSSVVYSLYATVMYLFSAVSIYFCI